MYIVEKKATKGSECKMFRPECFKMTNFDRFHRKAGGVQAGGVNALAGVLFDIEFSKDDVQTSTSKY